MILSIRDILSALILDILGEILGIFATADPDFRYGVAAVIQTLR